MWEFYLAGSEAAFRYDMMHVFHLQIARDQARVPLTRAYIEPEMARLRAIEMTIPNMPTSMKESPLTAWAKASRLNKGLRPSVPRSVRATNCRRIGVSAPQIGG